MSTLLEPFQYEFFRNALVVAVLAGALCGLAGVYVILRGMSYIGHGLAHAIFGFAVVCSVLGFNAVAGAMLGGLAAAMLINRVARRRTIGADAAIGVVTSASFAIGVAIISVVGSFTRNIEALLFGNVLGVTTGDVLLVSAVGLITGVIVFLRYRQLLFTTFDPEVAEVSGVSTASVDVLLAIILASTIASTMTVMGVTLIAATLVIPPVIARLLTDSFHRMLFLSVGIGAGCGFVGVYLSYYLDWSSGASVVLTASALFAIVYVWSAFRGRRAAFAGLDVN